MILSTTIHHDRRGRRCRLWVGAALSAVLFVLPEKTSAEFSAANFKRVWQEEFGNLLSVNPSPSSEYRGGGSWLPTDSRQPHPAVVRVVVPEGEATSFGSGTLVDVRGQHGMVITNWHVIRDAQGPIDVIFPDGFTSKARAIKTDADWDLAALVIWRPNVEPVKIAPLAPQSGESLTICGYGPGVYRSLTGRCTQYYSPREHLPQQMVELDVEARQGDSGGPIFNARGELAGVLFGAGQGTTLGSFGGRVDEFLASLAPDIGKESGTHLVSCPSPGFNQLQEAVSDVGITGWQSRTEAAALQTVKDPAKPQLLAPPAFDELRPTSIEPQFTQLVPNSAVDAGQPVPLFEKMKSGLAAIGLFALVVMMLKAAG